jgi:phosphatidylserine/phosphatidylglycerophosphate/cardiolipin synthase-like enzyme
MSPLAQAVLAGANSAPSTVSQVGSSNNTIGSGPIIGGEAFAAAVTQVVTAAKQEVIIESFILADTWITGQLRNAIANIDPSIPVYVLFTTDTSSTINLETEQTMANNVQQLLDPGRTHNVIVANWNGRIDINHDKSIIVDRSTLLVSNINMEPSADPLTTTPSGNDWYQMGIILTGDIAGVAASEATSAWTHAGAFATSKPGVASSSIPTRTAPGGSGCTPMIALGREVSAGESSSADQGFVSLYKSAQKELHVQTPNLNDEGALAALVSATNNVDVYIVLSKGFTGWTEDIPGEGGSNVSVVEDLPDSLKSGGNACHMHVRWYASSDNPGVAIDGTAVNGASHAKYASADSAFMVLGSQNMDTQSWQTSREFSVGIDNPTTTATFDAAFKTVWSRGECAFECGGCGSGGDGGPSVGGDAGAEGGTADAGTGTGAEGGASAEGGSNGGDAGAGGGEGGGYAFIEPHHTDRHHAVELAAGATETLSFQWQNASGAVPPADLSVEAAGHPVLQVLAVGDRPFVRAGLDVVPLSANTSYRLVFLRSGDSVGVTLVTESGDVIARARTANAPVADVVVPSTFWRTSIVSDQFN